MSDSYQAIYDAVRSRIGNGNVGDAVESVLRQAGISEAVSSAFRSMSQDFAWSHCCPSAVFRPKLALDGIQWCAFYGDNLMEGVAGFGETPDKAMRDFDAHWMWTQKQIDDLAAKVQP